MVYARTGSYSGAIIAVSAFSLAATLLVLRGGGARRTPGLADEREPSAA
jgi:hypothetical protein